MALISFWDRMRIPSYDNPEHCRMGVLSIDHDKCNCCGLCAKACPANALFLEGKGKDRKLRVQTHLQQCAACSDCMAICEQEAIEVASSYDFLYRYKVVMRDGWEAPRSFRT